MSGMKYNLSVIIGLIFLAINSLLGVLLSVYHPFNMWMNNFVIFFTTLLIYISTESEISAPFRISLPYFFSFCGFFQYVVTLFAPSRLQDNPAMVLILLMVCIELIIMVIVRYHSNIGNTNGGKSE